MIDQLLGFETCFSSNLDEDYGLDGFDFMLGKMVQTGGFLPIDLRMFIVDLRGIGGLRRS